MLAALHTDGLGGNLFSHAKQLHNGYLEGWTSIFCLVAQVIHHQTDVHLIPFYN
jgi:hypothetical protein